MNPRMNPLAFLLAIPALTAQAAEIPALDDIVVRASKPVARSGAGHPLTAADIAPLRAATSDSASLLREVPGMSLYGAGGVSSLPALRGLADDRLRIQVDGVDLVATCPNHMNSPLSYVDPTAVESARVHIGVGPVSAGGDSIGGGIVVESAAPEFAKSGQGSLKKGEAGAYYRSNGDARGAHLAATLASEQISLTYTGAHARANNYKAADDFKNYAFSGRIGHSLDFDEVGSTAYESNNQSVKLAWKNDVHLLALQYARQDTPNEGFPTQRMDMTDNVGNQFNLSYRGQLKFATLNARAWHEATDHKMDFGADKRFWYGNGAPPTGSGGPAATDGTPCSPISATCAAGMPMDTEGRNTGFKVQADIPLALADVFRVGGEVQRYRLDDWWSPSGAGMMPNTFWNVRDGERDRLALFGEWETRRDRWSQLLGLRHENVSMDAGAAEGYNSTTNGMAPMQHFQKRDADAFNAQSHGKTDQNWDLAWLARYKPDAGQNYEIGLAQKTRSPNLYERYTWSTWQMAALMNNFVGDGNGYVGNLELKPEVAHSLNFSAEWRSGERWSFKAAPHYTQVRDYIDAVQWDAAANAPRAVPVTGAWSVLKYVNQSARLYGLDLSGHLDLTDHLALKGQASYTRGENRDTGDGLYNIMPFNGRLTLTHKMGAWSHGLESELVAAKKQVSAMRNEMQTSGYGLIHLRGRYEQKGFSIDYGVENLLDRYYAHPLGGAYVGQGTTMTNPALPNYPQWGTPIPGPGRSLYAGLNVKF